MTPNRYTCSQSTAADPTQSSPSQQQEPWRDRMRPDWPVPQIQNVVATCNLDCRLDLKVIAQHARNVEYRPKKFHALIMRIRDPRTTTLVFASGRMVITGAKSEPLARLAARRHARLIQKCGFNTKFIDFKVQNFVSSASCGFHIRLEGFNAQNPVLARYEPEMFPGLVYTMVKPTLKCLVFTTGKVVLTGAKKEEDVYEAFVNLYPILLDFKVGNIINGLARVSQVEGKIQS